ncbi:MAG: hypothetical protein KDE27_24825 [Planctomycetes bacterium]|nr:hypothetical protein [Planctomycetota bacterium]
MQTSLARSSGPLWAGSLLATALFAQAPAAGDRLDPAGVQPGHGISASRDQLFASGPGYVARFEPGAVELLPILGATAPNAMPLRLEFEHVRRGTATPDANGADSAPQQVDAAVIYPRGAGVSERYTSSDGRLKQTVCFASPVAGHGDLTVRYRVTTELTCPATPAGGATELRFTAGELGSISVDTIVGIDATGRRAEGAMHFDGRHLDLTLPAEFVASAAYPLELDPFFGASINTGVSSDDQNPDIAYDNANDRYLAVFEFPFAANKKAVWGQLISGAGQRIGNAFAISPTLNREEHPAVGNCAYLDNFFVCWQDNSTGNWDIRGCTVGAAGNVGGVMTVAGGNADQVTPDCGGDSFEGGGPGLCIAVWDDAATGVFAAVLDMSTSPPSVTNTQQMGFAAPDPFRNNPSITKDGEDGGRWFVAMQHDTQFLSVTAVDFTGAEVSTVQTAYYSPNDVVDHPCIAGDGANWKVVFERNEPGSSTLHDIYAAYGTYDNNTGQVVRLGGAALENDQGEDERQPCIAHFGRKYVAGWTNPRPGGTRLEFQNIELDGLARCGGEQIIDAAGRAMSMAAITGQRESGRDSSIEGIVTHRNFNVGTGGAVIDSRRYRVFTGGPVTTLLNGCGTGGTCDVSGPAALGNDEFEIRLTGADPTAQFAIWMGDLFQGPHSSCGSCTRIDAPFKFFMLINGGQATFPLPLPCDPAYTGLVIDTQWVTLSPAAQPCAAFPDLQFSSARRIVLAN